MFNSELLNICLTYLKHYASKLLQRCYEKGRVDDDADDAVVDDDADYVDVDDDVVVDNDVDDDSCSCQSPGM